ncbi:MAG: hypothetical protein IAF58_18795 [Leptolyngbya sp.]|nr:hypothetical protein [Candidatus Melainabacteria bacterium]
MSLALIMLGLAVFALPIFFQIFYLSPRTVLYQGDAICRSMTKTIFEQRRRYALVFVNVPGHGEILTEISHARASSLGYVDVPVRVTLTQQAFKEPQIDEIVFADERVPEPPAPSYDGLGLSLYYFVVAFGSLVLMPGLGYAHGSGAERVGLFFAAICFAAAGFFINALSKDKVGDVKTAKTSLLFIPLGSGYLGLGILWALAVAATIACFWQFSILLLFPGIHFAFAVGSIPGVFLRRTKPPEPHVGPVMQN